ncbi:hypothetical protein [Prosthecobacter fusiformis]|nr:hypothetical protein [Prosthecobacter fusiformis]
MKSSITFALVVCALAAFPIVNPRHTAGSITPDELIAGLAFWPALAFSAFGVVAGLYLMITISEDRGLGVLWLLLGSALPLCVSSKKAAFDAAFDERHAWFDQTSGAGALNFYIHQIIMEDPDAIHFIDDTEEVTISGLAERVRRDGSIYYHDHSGRTRPMQMDGDKILSPWGAPIRFAVDRNHDGFISAGGQKSSTRYGVADPFTYDPGYKYLRASAVFVSLPDPVLSQSDSTMVTLDDNDFNRL